MNTRTIRMIHALLIALFLITGIAGPSYAQSSQVPLVKAVDLLMKDGWTAGGRQMAANDFVVVCPSKEVLDPRHPCSDANAAQVQAAQVQLGRFDDFVLVCPAKEVLDPNHPCFDRNAQIKKSIADDFVLVCPAKEVLDPTHPCSQQKAGAKFEIPGDFVLTCPVKEVLEQHPCAARSKGEGTLAVQQMLFLPSVSASGTNEEAPVTPIYYNNGPVHFNRVDDEVRGGIQFNAQAQCVNKVYTPVADSEGNLRMIGMSVAGNNLASLPESGDDFSGGSVKDLAITRLNGCNFMVTAVRTQNDTLKLISWFSSADGFDRLHDSGDSGIAVKQVALTNTNDPFFNEPGAGRIVTAVRSASDQLVVSLWYMDEESVFYPSQSRVDETITQVEIVSIAPPPGITGVDHGYSSRVVTAIRTTSGRLRLISWGISEGGGLYRLADSGDLAGNVQDFALARYDSDRVVTAVKNSDGNLQLIAWDLESEDEIERLDGEDDPTFNDPFAGQVQEIAITAFDFSYAGWKYVATAVRTEDGNLRLIAWGIDSYGNIKRHGDSENLAGAASHIEAGWSQESNRIVTTMKDGDGNLRAIAWTVQ